jgi:DNA-binding transcriptional MerR regulator
VTIEYTLEELAAAVQSWCDEHHIAPANGQASEELTERTIRYYRTLGLLDAPLGGYIKKFSHRHRLQLIAIRLFQAQGLPLRKIRDELYGKSLDDLLALEKQGAQFSRPTLSPMAAASANEQWNVIPLTADFLLISRQNRPVPRAVVEKIAEILAAFDAPGEIKTDLTKN